MALEQNKRLVDCDEFRLMSSGLMPLELLLQNTIGTDELTTSPPAMTSDRCSDASHRSNHPRLRHQ